MQLIFETLKQTQVARVLQVVCLQVIDKDYMLL